MQRFSWLISRYLITSVLPYFLSAWVLLSVILFVQQASRYSDTFFNVNIPTNLIWQLTAALVPNVIAFTCPMAVLVGVIIGLTRMLGDNELVAIRAAGVGNIQIAIPMIVLGLVMSAFAFVVNLRGVPLAASLVRSVALQTAIQKLESPIEPGVFNTEVNGYTIYVKGADLETNRWKNIFIYNEDPANRSLRLITSRRGRIDTTDQRSELVLENASVSTLPLEPGQGKYITESLGEIRFAIKTRRDELIDRVKATEIRPEELGLQELSEYAGQKEGPERTEAQILQQRRVILSITPLIFALLGTAIVLRFSRGGRGFAVASALAVLIAFYLLAFLGEQLARVGAIGVIASGAIPVLGSIAGLIWLSYHGKFGFARELIEKMGSWLPKRERSSSRPQARNVVMDLTTGLRDFDISFNLIAYFALAFVFLLAIFLIFTAFEMWRFAGTFDGGPIMLAKYLGYLLPFAYLQIAPSAAMVAVLATYVIKSRNNEIVTWTAAGQSVYRLLIPCFVLALLLGAVNFIVQEKVLPASNRLQDSTRTLIRNKGVPREQTGKYWVANEKRIYSFSFEKGQELASDNGIREGQLRLNREVSASDNAHTAAISRDLASDNAKRSFAGHLHTDSGQPAGSASDNAYSRAFPVHAGIPDRLVNDHREDRRGSIMLQLGRMLDREVPWAAAFRVFALASNTIIPSASDNENRERPCASQCVRDLIVYEFDDRGERLQAVYRADSAEWSSGSLRFIGAVEKNILENGRITTQTQTGGSIDETLNPFAELRLKPNHLNAAELKDQIRIVESDVEKRTLSVGLQKKYTTPLLPLVMALFTAPFALSLSRKGKAATVGYAVLLWLLFTGTVTVFDQAGLSGLLSPQLAVWAPVVMFASLGVFLLSKVRT